MDVINYTIAVVETKDYILASIEFETRDSVGWNVLHEIKNRIYPELEFVEIHPKKGNLIDNANVRHLYHLKGVLLPDLRGLENVTDYELIAIE